MIISITVTSHWIFGLKVEEKTLEIENFGFSLPFAKFRNANSSYWKEVIEKVYKVNSVSKENATLIIHTEDELLQKSGIVENIYRISEYLPFIKLPIIYVAESKAFVDGIIYPLVIRPADFYKWFNLAQNINEVENHFYNRQIYGPKLPENQWDRDFEEALFREKLSFLFENIQTDFLEKTNDLVLMGEGLIYAGEGKRVVLSLLDSVKSVGFWRLYSDFSTSMLNLQGIRKFNKDLGDKIYNNYTLSDLAGCLVVPGAHKASLKFTDGDSLTVNLEKDSISVIPLNKENKIDVKVEIFGSKPVYLKCSGGEFGLIVDNRSRPLLINENSKKRVANVERWLREINSNIKFDEATKLKVRSVDKFESNLVCNLEDKNKNNISPSVQYLNIGSEGLSDKVHTFRSGTRDNKVLDKVKGLASLKGVSKKVRLPFGNIKATKEDVAPNTESLGGKNKGVIADKKYSSEDEIKTGFDLSSKSDKVPSILSSSIPASPASADKAELSSGLSSAGGQREQKSIAKKKNLLRKKS